MERSPKPAATGGGGGNAKGSTKFVAESRVMANQIVASSTASTPSESTFQMLSRVHQASRPKMPDFKEWATRAQREDKYACDQSVVKVAADSLNPVAQGVLAPIVQYITGMVPVRGVWANIRVPRSDDLSFHELDIVVATLTKLVVFEVKNWEGEVHPTKGEWVMFKEPRKPTGWVEVEGRKDEWMVIQPDGSRDGRADPIVQVAAKAELLHGYLVRNKCIPETFGLAYFVLFTSPKCQLSPAIQGLDEVLPPQDWQQFLSTTKWDRENWVRSITGRNPGNSSSNSSARQFTAATSATGSVGRVLGRVQQLFSTLTGLGTSQTKLTSEQWKSLIEVIGALPTYDVLTFRDGTRVLGDLIRFDHAPGSSTDQGATTSRPPPPPLPAQAFDGVHPARAAKMPITSTVSPVHKLSSFSQRQIVSKIKFEHPEGVIGTMKSIIRIFSGSAVETVIVPESRPPDKGTALHASEPSTSLFETVVEYSGGAWNRFLSVPKGSPKTNGTLHKKTTVGEKQAATSPSDELLQSVSVPLETKIVFRPAGCVESLFTSVSTVKTLELSRNPVPQVQKPSSQESSGSKSPISLARVTAWLSGPTS